MSLFLRIVYHGDESKIIIIYKNDYRIKCIYYYQNYNT